MGLAMSSKDDLRRRIKTLLESQSSQARLEKSRTIAKKLFDLAVFKKARCVCFYMSMPEEADTSFAVDKALSLGKKVVLPCCESAETELRLYQISDRRTLKENDYGILEPVPDQSVLVDPAEVDLVVVPGLLFDRKNRRLGRGKGYYDRFLGRLQPGVFKVGLAFLFQVAEEIPTEAHDVKLDLVITD